MNTISSKRGFSLIELLTVIAIIAILAAVIFPIMTTAKRKAQESQCLTNLHQIAMGVQMFKQDNRRYPTILGSEVHDTSGGIWASTSGTPAIFENAKDNYLFAEYVKTIQMFHCPASRVANSRDISIYDESTPADKRLAVYTYDSYDSYCPAYSGGGDTAAQFKESDPNPKVERHYRVDWAPDMNWIETSGLKAYPPNGSIPAGDPTTLKEDYARQLKFRNPPGDTVVTWCSYHEDRLDAPDPAAYRGRSLVVFLDGHADAIPANEMGQCMWRTRPKKS